MTSPVWGGLAGLFGGASQGLQALMAMKQAEADRKRQAEQDEWQRGGPDRALEQMAYKALLDANVQISPQDYRNADARRTPGMPAMGATSALAQASGTRGASSMPEQSLGSSVAGAKSAQIQQAMAGQAPQTASLGRFGATVQPSEAIQVAAINAANRPQSAASEVSWEPVTGLAPGTPRLERHPKTGQTRQMRNPDGSPMMVNAESIQRSTVPEQVIRKSAGMAMDMAQAVEDMERVERESPEAVQEAAKYLTTEAGLSGIPVFGSAAKALFKRTTGVVSEPAQRFIRAMFQYRATAFPERGGANLTGTEIAEYSPVFDPQIGENPAAYQQAIEARRTRVRGAAFIAGNESIDDYANTFGRQVPEWLYPTGVTGAHLNTPKDAVVETPAVRQPKYRRQL